MSFVVDIEPSTFNWVVSAAFQVMGIVIGICLVRLNQKLLELRIASGTPAHLEMANPELSPKYLKQIPLLLMHWTGIFMIAAIGLKPVYEPISRAGIRFESIAFGENATVLSINWTAPESYWKTEKELTLNSLYMEFRNESKFISDFSAFDALIEYRTSFLAGNSFDKTCLISEENVCKEISGDITKSSCTPSNISSCVSLTSTKTYDLGPAIQLESDEIKSLFTMSSEIDLGGQLISGLTRDLTPSTFSFRSAKETFKFVNATSTNVTTRAIIKGKLPSIVAMQFNEVWRWTGRTPAEETRCDERPLDSLLNNSMSCAQENFSDVWDRRFEAIDPSRAFLDLYTGPMFQPNDVLTQRFTPDGDMKIEFMVLDFSNSAADQEVTYRIENVMKAPLEGKRYDSSQIDPIMKEFVYSAYGYVPRGSGYDVAAMEIGCFPFLTYRGARLAQGSTQEGLFPATPCVMFQASILKGPDSGEPRSKYFLEQAARARSEYVALHGAASSENLEADVAGLFAALAMSAVSTTVNTNDSRVVAVLGAPFFLGLAMVLSFLIGSAIALFRLRTTELPIPRTAWEGYQMGAASEEDIAAVEDLPLGELGTSNTNESSVGTWQESLNLWLSSVDSKEAKDATPKKAVGVLAEARRSSIAVGQGGFSPFGSKMFSDHSDRVMGIINMGPSTQFFGLVDKSRVVGRDRKKELLGFCVKKDLEQGSNTSNEDAEC